MRMRRLHCGAATPHSMRSASPSPSPTKLLVLRKNVICRLTEWVVFETQNFGLNHEHILDVVVNEVVKFFVITCKKDPYRRRELLLILHVRHETRKGQGVPLICSFKEIVEILLTQRSIIGRSSNSKWLILVYQSRWFWACLLIWWLDKHVSLLIFKSCRSLQFKIEKLEI